MLFPSGVRWDSYCFRVTRGAKDDPWDRLPLGETELNLAPGSIIGMVSAELTARKFAGIVRVEISSDMPEKLQSWLAENLAVSSDDIISIESPLALADLVKFQPEDCEHLRDPEHHPVDHPRLHRLQAQDTGAIFEEIRMGDILLHHPYQAFDTSVLRFIESAARDPQVLAIKLTIYRTGERSPVIQALTEAARRGKQVVVLVEITARFDEAPNIAWGEQLEKFLMCTKATTRPPGTCRPMGTMCAGDRRPAKRPAKPSSFSSNSPRKLFPRAAKSQGTIGITECSPSRSYLFALERFCGLRKSSEPRCLLCRAVTGGLRSVVAATTKELRFTQ